MTPHLLEATITLIYNTIGDKHYVQSLVDDPVQYTV